MLITFCQSVQNTLESTNRSLETSLGSSTEERKKGGEEGRGGRRTREENGGGRGERRGKRGEDVYKTRTHYIREK